MGLPMSDHMQKQDLLKPCFFEEAAREAALEEERQKEEESQRKLQEEQEMERQLAAKEACLPNEPSPDDENVVTFLVRMPDGSRRGRRFLKSDKLQGGEHDGVLTITINDMGKYGCFPDCSEMMSKPVFAEATINLRRGRLMSSVVAHSLGSAIMFEFIALFSLGMVLMLFTCKCALVLIRERKGRQNDQVQNVKLSGVQHASNETLRTDSSENTSHFIGCRSSSLLFGHHPTNFRRGFKLGESSQSTQGTLKPIKAYGLPVSELDFMTDFMDYFLYL